jgi:hypothetical protein
MRRIAIGIVVVSICLAFAAGSMARGRGGSVGGSQPIAAVVVAACHPSDDVTQRFATFVGMMRSVPKTAKMAMRLTLLEKLHSPDFTAVALPDLRPWRRSKKGATSFIYTQRVTALRDGGAYRMRVQFRWYDSSGKVLKTRTVRSGACHQPEELPNLHITAVSVAPGTTPGTSRYLITLENDGSGDAGAIGVALRVDGGAPTTGQVPALAAGTSTTVELDGPACATTVRAIADPLNRIKETDESDNTFDEACPSSA